MQNEASLPSRLASFVLPRGMVTAEYSIYAYDFYEDQKIGHNRWQRVATTTDLETALSRASTLYQSGSYQKIEVKKKIYNDVTGRHKYSLFRVFERRKRRSYIMTIFSVIMFLICCGFSYFLYTL